VIRRNTLFAFAAQVVTAAFAAVLALYLVRALGTSDYGVFAVAVSFGALVVLPSDFGVTGATQRFVAERRGDTPAVVAILAGALRLKLVTTTVVCALLAAFSAPIASAYGIPELTWPLRAIAAATLGQSVMALYGGAVIALGRLPRYLRMVCAESVAETGATIALVAVWGGATAATLGRAIGFLSGAAVACALCLRLFGRGILRIRGKAGGDRRSLARYAGAVFVVDSSFMLFSQIDVLLVGAFLGASAAGIYQAPIRLITVLHYPGLAVASSIAPRVAGSAGEVRDTGAFRTALKWLIVLQGALVAPLFVWARPITDVVLGAEYAQSADVLRALLPFVFLSGFAPLVSTAVNYLGQARRRVPITIATLVISVAVDVVLIPAMGVTGAAVGADVAYALYVPAHLWICARLLNLPLRPVLATLARALLGAGVMALVLASAGTDSLTPVEWAWGTVAGLLTYAAALVVSGEISHREFMALGGVMSGRLTFRTRTGDR
jgi:O-antigen/teichoic acid export membrane protein